MKMVATYERGKALNVREHPHGNAKVVGELRHGESAEVLEIRDGWAKLEEGYANVAFLFVKLCDALGETTSAITKAAQPLVEEVAHAADSAEPPEEAGASDATELESMTVPQLHDLAEQSGIKLTKNMKKPDIIAAILTDD